MNEDQITRREFLRAAVALGGAAVVAPLLGACLPREMETAPPAPSPTTSPTPIPPQEKLTSQVALVKTSHRAEGVMTALDLLGINPAQGKAVFLKPNFNSADPAPGSTHKDTLSSLVKALWEMGAREITLAERSGMGDTNQVMREKGIFQMAEELNFSVINLDELGEDGWVHVRPQNSHWRDGFLFARPCLEAECVVQTCCLKTHRFGGHFTLSLKNSVALVPRHGYNFMGELHNSPYQRLMIAELNEPYSPDLIVLDGIEAFTDGGPDRGTKVRAEVMLAGTDRVAVDAVGVAILRHLGTTPQVSRGPIFEQEQIARAVELALGVSSPDEIQIVTGDEESEKYAQVIRDALARG